MSHSLVRQYIQKLGGIHSVAALAAVEPTTVSAWQARLGTFPPDTFHLFRRELRRRRHLRRDQDPPAWLFRMKGADLPVDR